MTKIQILESEIDPDNFDDKGLPSDVHIVSFTENNKLQHDAVRAYTMVDIFDAYYDRLGKDNPIHSIKAGFGTVRPNLYGKIKDKTDEKK